MLINSVANYYRRIKIKLPKVSGGLFSFFMLLLIGLSACDKLFIKKEPDRIDPETVAIVDSVVITKTDLQQEIDFYLSYLPYMQDINPSGYRSIYAAILDNMINEQIMLQAASKHAVLALDFEFSNILEKTTNAYDAGNIKIWLDSVSINNDFWHEKLRRRIIIKKLLEKLVYNNVSVSRQEVDKYYQAHISEFNIPEKREVYHLQLTSKDLVNVVFSELKRGISFERMVDAYSVAIDRYNRGNLGFIDANSLPKIFSDPIFSIEKTGNITSPIQTSYGYHIFMVNAITPPQKSTLEEEFESIKKILIAEKSKDIEQLWFEQLKSLSNIRINEELLDLYSDF